MSAGKPIEKVRRAMYGKNFLVIEGRQFYLDEEIHPALGIAAQMRVVLVFPAKDEFVGCTGAVK